MTVGTVLTVSFFVTRGTVLFVSFFVSFFVIFIDININSPTDA